MKKTIFYALAILSFVSTIAAASSEDIALKLVQKYNFGQNLSVLSYQAAKNSQIYQIIVSEVGEKKAQSMVKSELNKLIPKYQAQWNENLASAYAQVLSGEKLQSLFDKGRSSQYASELKTKQTEVGPIMQSKSNKLLVEMVAQAMTSAFGQIAPK